MIRQATLEDIPEMVRMGQAFYDYADFGNRGLAVDHKAFGELLANLMQMKESVLLVAEDKGQLVGAIGGMMAPWILNYSQQLLTELWWWVMPEHQKGGIGIKLIEAFQAEGKARGASHVIMVTLAGDKEGKLMSVYSKMGFNHLEHHFIKEL